MSKEKKDPTEGLEQPDTALATDLGDEDKRRSDQLEYYGGDAPDETESEDLTKLDRGDNFEGNDDGSTSNDDDKEEDDESSGKSQVDEGKEKEGSDDGDEDEGSDTDPEPAETDDEADGEAEGEQPGEVDDDEDEESEDDDDEEDEEEDGKKDSGIPRHRFNEVNQRMKDAEAENTRLKAEKTAGEDATVEKYDFDKNEEEYMALLLDGKTKEAGAKRREIREAEKADFKAETKAETVSEVGLSAIEKSLNDLTTEAEGMFPIFDQNSDDFNPAAVSKTLTFMRGYQVEGMNADDAFVAALADMIDLFKLDVGDEVTGSQSDDDTKKPEEKGKKVTEKKLTAEEKKAAVEKKRKAAEKQGKSPVGEGKGSADVGAAVPNIDDMTDEEIEALPAETLARLRGDFI